MSEIDIVRKLGVEYGTWAQDTIVTYYHNSPETVSFVAGMFGCLMIVYAVRGFDRIEAALKARKLRNNNVEMRGKLMTPEQENLEKVLIADGFTDVLEDMEYRGKMSRERKLLWYRRIGNIFNLPDLLAKHELLLKQQLQKKYPKGKLPDTIDELPLPDTALMNTVVVAETTKRNGLLGRLKTKTA